MNLSKNQTKSMILRRVTAFVALLLCVCMLSNPMSLAAGSKNLVSDYDAETDSWKWNGGYRPYTEWYNASTSGILRHQIIYVYVYAGETLLIGSSVAAGVDGVDIAYTKADGTTTGTLDVSPVSDTALGYISTKVKDPTVKAVDGDSYMRVKMTITDAEGATLTDETLINYILTTICYDSTYALTDGDTFTVGTNVVEGTGYTKAAIDALPDYNTTDFTYDASRNSAAGVRYYNYTANSGIFTEGTRAVLFTNIAIPTDYTATEIDALGTGYKIVLEAQAIQSTGIASAAAAYTALDA
ncbi:MAG: hypothetical protein GX851_05310 [Clostridiales bacterium]|nr:hypothetical protein [Clostridiales bacterium]